MRQLIFMMFLVLLSSLARADTLFTTPETCKDGDVIVFRTDHYICETPLVANEHIIISPGACAATITTQQPLKPVPQLAQVNPLAPAGLPKSTQQLLTTKISTLGKVVSFDRPGDLTTLARKQFFLKGN